MYSPVIFALKGSCKSFATNVAHNVTPLVHQPCKKIKYVGQVGFKMKEKYFRCKHMKHHATVQTVRERYNSRREKVLKKLLRISSRRLMNHSRALWTVAWCFIYIILILYLYLDIFKSSEWKRGRTEYLAGTT